MTTIKEGRLEIEFDTDHWHAIKYDESKDFKKFIQTTPNIKGADIVALNGGKKFVIEIKDYNGFEEEVINNLKSDINKLTDDLTRQILDTVLGCKCLTRNPKCKETLWNDVDRIFQENRGFHIIFWIDGNLSKYSKNFSKTQLSNQIKRKLRCLGANVIIRDSNGPSLPNTSHSYTP